MNIIFSGTKSPLKANFSPALDLREGSWEIGLIDFFSFNSIPNITDVNNVIGYYENEVKNRVKKSVEKSILCDSMREKRDAPPPEEEGVTTDIKLPKGAYELKDVERFLQNNIHRNITLTPDIVTVRVELYTPVSLDFSHANSIAKVLGFEHKIYPPGNHTGEHTPNITTNNSIRIQCNIADGGYINGQLTHTIYAFYPAVPPSYKIIQVPNNIIYSGVITKQVNTMIVDIVNENNETIDFMDETIFIRLHLRKVIN